MSDRNDYKQNQDKIAAYYTKHPKATLQEASNALWVAKQTVANHLKNLDEIGNKDDRIVSLTDDDLAIVIKSQELIMQKLCDEKEVKKLWIRDISQVAKDSTWRYSMFRGDVTDEQWWLKDFRNMSDDELYDLITGNK